jgi:hypothetical protein
MSHCRTFQSPPHIGRAGAGRKHAADPRDRAPSRRAGPTDEWWAELWRDYLVVFYAVLLPGLAVLAMADNGRHPPAGGAAEPPGIASVRPDVRNLARLPTD